ncbi:MAG: serine--tRNA ligase, partial [Deltaproteobacteria bacterium]
MPPAVVEQRRQLGARISALEAELREVEAGVDEKALFVPNLPLPDLPDGDAACNVVVRAWGEPAAAGGAPHWEIGERLGIFTSARGTKLAGSGFPLFLGQGARLVRALIA